MNSNRSARKDRQMSIVDLRRRCKAPPSPDGVRQRRLISHRQTPITDAQKILGNVAAFGNPAFRRSVFKENDT